MKPKDDKTDYTSCPNVCLINSPCLCGCCELIRLANVADKRKLEGRPVVTPIANPLLMAQLQQMQQMQMNVAMLQMQQQQAAAAAPAAAPAPAATPATE